MNKQAVWAIIRKDMRAVFSSAQMWLPMVIVPLVFIVVYPLIILFAFQQGADMLAESNNAKYLSRVISSLPAGTIRSEILAFHSVAQQMGYLFLNYMFSPLFLLLPIMTSSIISANSFAGEKEKKTLESLLYSPISEENLLFSKVIAAFLPSLAITLLSAVVYGVIMDTVGYGFFGRFIFPSFNWLLTILWLSPAISLLSVFLNVFISAKVKGFQEAQQFSVIVILPLIAIFIAQMTGFLFLGNIALFFIGLGLFIIDALLIHVSAGRFNRQKLFLSQI